MKFLVQKLFRLLGRENQSVQVGRKQTISTGTNLTVGEAVFKQFIRLRIQLIVAVTAFSKEENLAPVQVKLLVKDMEQQLLLTHKVVESVD